MALSTPFSFTTGPSALPDAGELSYNNCKFSPLFATTVSGTCVPDASNRTVKYMEYTLMADGYVTMPDGFSDINFTMGNLRILLTERGGTLTYKGRGFDIVVNPPGGSVGGTSPSDVAWGPEPKLLEFQPLGAGRSAKIRWQCTFRVSEQSIKSVVRIGGTPIPLLQFNYETNVAYGEDGFSSISVKGTMEIPLTRTPSIKSRSITYTVDNLRSQLDDRIFKGIDLTRFRVVRRNFTVSRDKRTMEFDIECEEKPYMDLPPLCTVARGTYNVRPAKTGMGLCNWLCTLRATYTLEMGSRRRVAWFAFLNLLRVRMQAAINGFVPKSIEGKLGKPKKGDPDMVPFKDGFRPRGPVDGPAEVPGLKDSRNAWIIDFSFDEGLYLDSKTISFSATWRLVTSFDRIFLASGIWHKVEGGKRNLWSTSIKNIMGSESWFTNRVDPKLDAIVDFGG